MVIGFTMDTSVNLGFVNVSQRKSALSIKEVVTRHLRTIDNGKIFYLRPSFLP